MTAPEQSAERAECPTCGPTMVEQNPRHTGVIRCANCKEWLSAAETAQEQARAASMAAAMDDASYHPATLVPEDRWMVTQTILASTELNNAGVYGNCIQAAVASALGWHLDAVPHFGAFREWYAALQLWAKGEGLIVEWLDYPDEIPSDEERCLYLGTSPRGYLHVVVGQNRKVVWDPHPSRDGLVEVTDVIRVYRPFPPAHQDPR